MGASGATSKSEDCRIFKRKLDADGTVERYKARLVAQGCTQMFGLDYEETFSPVIRFESVRFLLAIGALHQLQLHQMDVSTAFLHGELTDEVYMRQPEGFIEPGKEHLVCHLKRRLKQSPRCWNHTMDNRLKEMGRHPVILVCTCTLIQKEKFLSWGCM